MKALNENIVYILSVIPNNSAPKGGKITILEMKAFN